ncbi:hypothetical protein cyc_04452 [Cyclospora cayetanensis]|uniref:Uncharacterized protein n=1 Tax=Cyclospora cayetanensis TaxID=88456 RepID=A0A1D3D8E7_9EIME|nr:hypothetical protein cyc_04452 [Cyclospora cayetanensis]
MQSTRRECQQLWCAVRVLPPANSNQPLDPLRTEAKDSGLLTMEDVADVPYEGVVGWLLCRRLLPEDYHQRLKGVWIRPCALVLSFESGMTAHVNAALETPPESQEAAKLIAEKKGGPFGYREVEELVQILMKEGAVAAFAAYISTTEPTLGRSVSGPYKDSQHAGAYATEDSTAETTIALIRQQGAELLAFYRSFVAFSTSENTSKEARNDSLPLLALLSEMGNVLLAEAAAAAPEIPVLQQQVQDDTAAAAVQIEIQQQGDEGGLSDLDDLPADHTCWIVEEGEGTWNGSSATDNSSNITDSLLGSAAVRRQLLLELTELRGFLVLNELMAARAQAQKPLSAAKEQQRREASLSSEMEAAAALLDKQRGELQQLVKLLHERMATAVNRKVRITGIPRDRLP